MDLWACVCGDILCAAPDEVHDCCREKGITEPPHTFVIYEMADGSMVWDEYQWVTDLEFFDDRDEEIKLIKKTYRLISEEEIVMPDPFPIEPDEDDEDSSDRIVRIELRDDGDNVIGLWDKKEEGT